MDWKHSKTFRILDLYERFCEGHIIRKTEEAARFGIDERSVQRDIDDLRAYLDERAVNGYGDGRSITYDRQKKGFILTGYQSPLMTNSEVLAVSKILLESRAFTKQEMSNVLDKLISGCVPQDNMKLVSDLLANEKYHYAELNNPVGIQDKLWDIGSDIRSHRLMEMEYERQNGGTVKRIVEPVAILFSEYYFYLNAYLVEPDEHGVFHHAYDYPAVYRIDRIVSYHLREERFRLPYSTRFQEGEYRKRIQFMYAGELQTVRIKYTGWNVDAILDRLPTAKIVDQGPHSYYIQTEVFGKGILMWLLSQGKYVEVLSPPQLREEMKQTLQRMLAKYEDH